MRATRTLALVALALGATAACTAPTDKGGNPIMSGNAAKTATVQVEAEPTLCWSGAIGAGTKQGCGPMTYEIEGMSGIFVANAQKRADLDPTYQAKMAAAMKKGQYTITDARPLTLVLLVNGKELARESTSADAGVVQVSN